MNTTIKVAAFPFIVVGVFLLAFLAGKVIDVDDPAPAGAHQHGTNSRAAADDYSLKVLGDATAPATERRTLRFEVLDGDGEAVTAYSVRHEKKLHLIVVEKQDPRIYQHLHPKLGADGVWSVGLRLAPGSYRLYADTQPSGAEPVVLEGDVEAVGSRPPHDPLPSPNREATVDGFTVGLAEAGDMLSFQVKRDGKPVQLEPYLGAGGHLVAIRAEDLDYLHAHPMEGTDQPIGFHVEFDEPGRYVLHFDFQVDGVVHSATFVYDKYAEASKVPESEMTDHDMGEMGDGEMGGHDMGEMSGHEH